MRNTQYGEMVLCEDDLCDLMMQGRDITALSHAIIDPGVDLQVLLDAVENPGAMPTWQRPDDSGISVTGFHARQQAIWFMPDEYRDTDIAKHVLDLCHTPQQLQRVAQELLLYQERDLFDLLRYLRYLVAVMRQNGVIWGVGRGSSVSSYVLYLLGVHRIDSMFYDLDPREFLR